jgi:hypothetical protein
MSLEGSSACTISLLDAQEVRVAVSDASVEMEQLDHKQ